MIDKTLKLLIIFILSVVAIGLFKIFYFMQENIGLIIEVAKVHR